MNHSSSDHTMSMDNSSSDHTMSMDHSSSDHTSSHMVMNMQHSTSFFFSTSVRILFDSWETSNDTGYALSLLAIIALAVFTMYLKSVKKNLHQVLAERAHDRAKGEPKKLETEETSMLNPRKAPDMASAFLDPFRNCCACVLYRKDGLVLILFFTLLEIIFSYCLMLIVMTYEVGVFFSVCLGLIIGHMAFMLKPSHVTPPNEGMVQLVTQLPKDENIVLVSNEKDLSNDV